MKCTAVGGHTPNGPPLPPRRGRLHRVSLLDREAEAGCRRKSHDGVCTVRGKVTLIIHEQTCKLVSILWDKRSGCGSQRRVVGGGGLNGDVDCQPVKLSLHNLESTKSHCCSPSPCHMWDLELSLSVSFHWKTQARVLSAVAVRGRACAALWMNLCADCMLILLVIWLHDDFGMCCPVCQSSHKPTKNVDPAF